MGCKLLTFHLYGWVIGGYNMLKLVCLACCSHNLMRYTMR